MYTTKSILCATIALFLLSSKCLISMQTYQQRLRIVKETLCDALNSNKQNDVSLEIAELFREQEKLRFILEGNEKTAGLRAKLYDICQNIERNDFIHPYNYMKQLIKKIQAGEQSKLVFCFFLPASNKFILN